jgi:hypothetical protein
MTNVRGIITENIRDTIRLGLLIYDVESARVGTVESVNLDTGWFTARTEAFPEPVKTLCLPFSLITNIDPHDLFVSKTRDELLASYTAPPRRTVTAVKEDGKETAITTEPSGYDGSPIVVERKQIDRLKTRIAVGQRVSTSDMVDLGTITEYDRGTGWMRVEKGILAAKSAVMIPVTLVDSIDPDMQQVYLAVSESDMQRMTHLEPA